MKLHKSMQFLLFLRYKWAVFIQGASAVQIGKILSKLSDTDERIVKDHSGYGRFYYLPVKKRLYDTLKMNG